FVAKEAKRRGMIDAVPMAATRPALQLVFNDEPSAARGREKERETMSEKKLTLEELRAQYPELYQQVFEAGRAAGVEQERKRVRAHLTLAAKTGAVEIAHKAIEAGTSVTDEEVHAEYLAAGLNLRDRKARQIETDEAGRVADGAK